MRLRSKWLLFALPVLAVAAGCSEYDHVQNIKLDEVNPEFVLPLVNDKMGLEEVIQQAGDKSKIKFDQDGLAYMQYNREIVHQNQIVPNEIWTGDKQEIRFAAGSTGERYVFINVHPYGNLSIPAWPTVGAENLGEAQKQKLLAKIRVKEATLASSSTTVKLKLVQYPGASVDLTGCRLKGKLEIFGGQQTPIDLAFNVDNAPINFGNVLNSKDYKINMALGAEMLFPNEPNFTYVTKPTDPNAAGLRVPFSYGHSEIPLHFTDLQLVDASGSAVTDKEFGLNAEFVATGVKPTRIVGEIDERVYENMNMKWSDVERSISLFDNVYSAQLALPKANLEVRVNKPKDFAAKLKIDQMTAEYNGTNASTVEILPIANTPTTDPDALKVDNTENNLDEGVAEKTFVLKEGNSNFGQAFEKGVKIFKVKGIELEFVKPSSAAASIELPIAKSSINLDVNLPFYGRAVSNKFIRTKPVDLSVVGKKYTDYLAGDDKAQIGQNGEAGVDGVTLLFRFKNGFPFDMYTTMEFLDEAKQSIMKLRLQAEDAQGSSNAIGLPLLMMAGKVGTDGKVVAPVVTHAVAKLSRAEFKVLQERAKFIRSEYAATTPGAGQNENVGIYKGYEIQVGIAVDIKGRLTFGK